MKIIHLEISSWVGTCAIGAQHYYGKLRERDSAIENEIELKRPLTAKERREYNAEMVEQGYPSLKATKDQTTRGFANEAEVITHAIKTAKETWPDGEFLIVNADHYSCSAAPIVYAPDYFKAEQTRANEIAAQWEKIERTTRYKPGYPPELEALDEEFTAIIEKARTYEAKTKQNALGVSTRSKAKVSAKDNTHT